MQDRLLVAAVATGAAYVVLEWRSAIHEWRLISGDLAPIFAVVWLAAQIVCKIIVTTKRDQIGGPVAGVVGIGLA
jgi:hypothetical protein